MFRHASLILLLVAAPALGQLVSYECASIPQNDPYPWVYDPDFYPGQYWVSAGWLVQHCEMATPQEGEQDYFYRTLPEMAGLPRWFLEWRMFTDGPQDFVSSAPAAMSAGSFTSAYYRFIIAKDRAMFDRGNQVPLVFADIQPGVPHTYRLELVGSQSYTWYIDGQVIASGVPQGPYPVSSSRITFGDRASMVANSTQWSYVRYGRTPVDHSGDYDSDGLVTAADLYFFVDCLLAEGYDSSGPGCRFADMNVDGKADGADIQLFVNAMTGG